MRRGSVGRFDEVDGRVRLIVGKGLCARDADRARQMHRKSPCDKRQALSLVGFGDRGPRLRQTSEYAGTFDLLHMRDRSSCVGVGDCARRSALGGPQRG